MQAIRAFVRTIYTFQKLPGISNYYIYSNKSISEALNALSQVRLEAIEYSVHQRIQCKKDLLDSNRNNQYMAPGPIFNAISKINKVSYAWRFDIQRRMLAYLFMLLKHQKYRIIAFDALLNAYRDRISTLQQCIDILDTVSVDPKLNLETDGKSDYPPIMVKIASTWNMQANSTITSKEDSTIMSKDNSTITSKEDSTTNNLDDSTTSNLDNSTGNVQDDSTIDFLNYFTNIRNNSTGNTNNRVTLEDLEREFQNEIHTQLSIHQANITQRNQTDNLLIEEHQIPGHAIDSAESQPIHDIPEQVQLIHDTPEKPQQKHDIPAFYKYCVQYDDSTDPTSELLKAKFFPSSAPSIKTVNILLNALAYHAKLTDVLSLLDIATKKYQLEWTPETYIISLRALDRTCQSTKIFNQFESMKQQMGIPEMLRAKSPLPKPYRGSKELLDAYTVAVFANLNEKRVSDADTLMHEMISLGMNVEFKLLGAVLKAVCSTGNVAGAANIIQRIHTGWEVRPVRAQSKQSPGYGSTASMDSQVVSFVQRPQQQQYNPAAERQVENSHEIKSQHSDGEIDGKEVPNQHQKSSDDPTSETSKLLDNLQLDGVPSDTVEALKQALASSKPTMVQSGCWVAVLKGSRQPSMLPLIHLAFSRLMQNDCQIPHSHIYNMTIAACGRCSGIDAAEVYISAMKGGKVKMTKHNYLVLLGMYSRLGKSDAFEKMLSEMRKRFGSRIVNSVNAVHQMRAMEENGLGLDHGQEPMTLSNSTFHGGTNQSNTNVSNNSTDANDKTLQQSIVPMQINIALKGRRLIDAKEMYKQLQPPQLNPHTMAVMAKGYLTLKRSFKKALAGVEEIYQDALARNIVPSDLFFSHIFRAISLRLSSKRESSESTITATDSRGQQPTGRQVESVEFNSQTDVDDLVNKWLDRAHACPPTLGLSKTYVQVAQCYAQQEYTNSAKILEHFDTMVRKGRAARTLLHDTVLMQAYGHEYQDAVSAEEADGRFTRGNARLEDGDASTDSTDGQLNSSIATQSTELPLQHSSDSTDTSNEMTAEEKYHDESTLVSQQIKHAAVSLWESYPLDDRVQYGPFVYEFFSLLFLTKDNALVRKEWTLIRTHGVMNRDWLSVHPSVYTAFIRVLVKNDAIEWAIETVTVDMVADKATPSVSTCVRVCHALKQRNRSKDCRLFIDMLEKVHPSTHAGVLERVSF